MTEQDGPTVDKDILSYYDGFDEAGRLKKRGSGLLEFARMQELISRHLPAPPGVVLDIGGAAGAYSCWLAESQGASRFQRGRAHRRAPLRSRTGREGRDTPVRRESPERAEPSLVGAWGNPPTITLRFPPGKRADFRSGDGRTAVRPYEIGGEAGRKD